MHTAKIDEISTLYSLRSRIDEFRSTVLGALSLVNSRSGDVLNQMDEPMQRIESKKRQAEERLEVALRVYHECLDRQSRCKEGERISCDCELREVDYRQSIVDRITHIYEQAQLLLSLARKHYRHLESMVNATRVQAESSAYDAASALGNIRGHAQDYMDVKAPESPPVTAGNNYSGGFSSSASPSVAANPSAASTKTGHILQLPPEMKDAFNIHNQETSSSILDGDGQQIARIKKNNDNSAMLLHLKNAHHETLFAVERIMQQNGIVRISRWVNQKELNVYLDAGFVVREGSITASGCVVEKCIK